MGRLFWKFLLAFWAALLLAVGAVAIVITLHSRATRDEQGPLAGGPRASLTIDAAAAILQFGGAEALRSFLADTSAPERLRIVAVDDADHELTRRVVSADTVATARQRASAADRLVRSVEAPDRSHWLLFIPAEGLRASPTRAPPSPPPSPALPVVAVVFASLVFSGILAWYVVAPIRHLRAAFGAVAQGRLDTRVSSRMRARRDEIADLARDFDGMTQQLELLVTLQRRLLNDVSHELRSPLARLQVAIGLARQNPARLETMLDRVEQESTRLNTLVGEIMALARLEADPNRERVQRIDLAELVAGVVDDARFEANASKRDVRFAQEGDVIITGQLEALHRALENVIRNGVRYTSQGSTVDVRLQARITVGGARQGLITIADRGPGVPVNELKSIFKPFYRASNNANRDGFGLGLAIASRAIVTHGGSIKAELREGGGLCVEIVLPAQSLDEHDVAIDAVTNP
jgi:two-component system, OmpR family, sensor kinase